MLISSAKDIYIYIYEYKVLMILINYMYEKNIIILYY
jgi:hypothetical protein